MLEIVVNASELYLLNNCKLFNKEDIISFCVMASYGNLNEITKKSKRKICNQILDTKNDFDILNQKLLNHKSVRIWYSSIDSEYICNMCYLVNYLKDYNIEINLCDTYKENCMHLSSCMEVDIKNLLDKTHKLTNDEINKISIAWEKLVSENNDLRILNGNNIESHPFSYLDDKILKFLSTLGSISFFEFIGLCMGNGLCNYFAFDFIFEDRINFLIEQNKIKIDRIVIEKNSMNRDIAKKYISLCIGSN